MRGAGQIFVFLLRWNSQQTNICPAPLEGRIQRETINRLGEGGEEEICIINEDETK